jgi:hypothetical protein
VHGSWVTSITYLPKLHHLYTTSEDGAICALDGDSLHCELRYEAGRPVKGFVSSQTEHVFVSWGADRDLYPLAIGFTFALCDA